jgi:hypothetical protein
MSHFKAPMNCAPFLGQPKLEFSGVRTHIGEYAEEPFISHIGGLLPIALYGRISLYSLRQSSIF